MRALNYIHRLNVMHRDIKPQNLLIDPSCHILKVCDFGSAKKISPEEETSVSYITSRYYRAPELMFGARKYNHTIDLWSAGCVVAELLLGEPLFKGEMAHSQLIEIIKKLGSPSEEQILKMNPDYKRKGFPMIEPQPWDLVSILNDKHPCESSGRRFWVSCSGFLIDSRSRVQRVASL